MMLHFLQTASEYDMEVTTHCVMPDHLHILATGLTDAAELKEFVKIAKQQAGVSVLGSQVYSHDEVLDFIVGADEWIPERKRGHAGSKDPAYKSKLSVQRRAFSCGCDSVPSVFISRSNRAGESGSPARWDGNTLVATSRPSRKSRAR
jgi:REP element-mobilizing transposase RayT